MTTINPRNRPLAQVSRAATQPARITQAARPTTSDPALNAWIGAMHEWRHVREGGGNPFEKVLTGRDLVNMGIVTSTQITNPSTPARREQPGVVVHDGQGGSTIVGFEEFAASIRGTRLYHDLVRKIDDPTRFDELHARTKAALLEELAPIDGKIRGEIRRVEEIATSTREALAQEVTTIRASVARASAGVRQVRAASANENRATAAQVTTVTARLDDFDGGGATVEETMTAIADRATGLEAQYTLKVTAGGAMAGFGLAATDNGSGNATSAFIIQADKFAIVSSSYAGGLDTTPDTANIPFGVDADGAYVGGNLKVTGKAVINGTNTVDSLDTALVLNSGYAAECGLRVQTNTPWDITLPAAIRAFGDSGGTAIYAVTSGGVGNGWSLYAQHTKLGGGGTGGAVYGYAVIGGTGVKAVGGGGATALAVEGPMTIDNDTLVSNLNAYKLEGNRASAFATASHNHSGVYIPVGGTAGDSNALGGTAAASWCRVVVGNTGTANASGNGFNMQMGTGLAPTYEVNCSGNNIILQTSSDERLKQDIAQEEWGLDFVLQMAAMAKQFRFRSDPSRLQHGWVAQDVEALVGSDAIDALVFTNPNGMKGVNHLMAIAPMTRAIAALHARLTAIGA